jgi:hypothetical protein
MYVPVMIQTVSQSPSMPSQLCRSACFCCAGRLKSFVIRSMQQSNGPKKSHAPLSYAVPEMLKTSPESCLHRNMDARSSHQMYRAVNTESSVEKQAAPVE